MSNYLSLLKRPKITGLEIGGLYFFSYICPDLSYNNKVFKKQSYTRTFSHKS